jgi:hypothetical protein
MTSSPQVLREATIVLGCTDCVLLTAAFFRHRYVRQHDQLAGLPESQQEKRAGVSQLSCPTQSLNECEHSLISACLFLSAKTCEESRRIRDVLNAVHLATHNVPLHDSRRYWELKEELVIMEQRLLRGLGFHTCCIAPHLLFCNCLRVFKAPHAMYELGYGLINDSVLCSDSLALQPERLLVAASIVVGAALIRWPLPAGWIHVLQVDERALTSACHAVLDVYSASKR